MASLREAADQLTSQLDELVNQMREELTEGDVDFERLGGIADQISERADGLAETFSSVNETLMQRIGQVQQSGGSEGEDSDEGEKSGSQKGKSQNGK